MLINFDTFWTLFHHCTTTITIACTSLRSRNVSHCYRIWTFFFYCFLKFFYIFVWILSPTLRAKFLCLLVLWSIRYYISWKFGNLYLVYCFIFFQLLCHGRCEFNWYGDRFYNFQHTNICIMFWHCLLVHFF